ncbi:hypothetical protein APHAL10511_005669 [Amanita phalloides]|nr:hypothetical protein APHAL10511_005669 [Amanita phalloides]
MRAILKLPSLPDGTAQGRLAGLLPLSPLIDFTDVVKMLHFYELSGRNIAWNWPMTPAGARLLLNHCTSDENEVCLLDANGRTPSMHCIDMRWGDHYTCANSYTVRSCIKNAFISKSIIPETTEKHFRRQKLNVVRIFNDSALSRDVDAESGCVRAYRDTWKLIVFRIGGWAIWLAGIVLSMLCACPLTFGYLLALAVSGFFVKFVFGHRPRPLSAGNKGKFWRRSVVVAEHMNETEWTIFIGDSTIVDSLLNKPLLPAQPNTLRRVAFFGQFSLLKLSLKFIVAAQWGLLIAASILQTWDALLIAVVLMFCACVTTFIFRPEVSLDSWLRSNGAGLEKLTVTFSGRRSMLSAMVAINPDRGRMGWIDPILKTSNDRSPWELALKGWMWDHVEPDNSVWWTAAIKEGVEKAAIINGWLLARERANHEPDRQPEQRPFNDQESGSDNNTRDSVAHDEPSSNQWWRQCRLTFATAIRDLFSGLRHMKNNGLDRTVDSKKALRTDVSSMVQSENSEKSDPDRRKSLKTLTANTRDANVTVLASSSASQIPTSSLSSRHVSSSFPDSTPPPAGHDA